MKHLNALIITGEAQESQVKKRKKRTQNLEQHLGFLSCKNEITRATVQK